MTGLVDHVGYSGAILLAGAACLVAVSVLYCLGRLVRHCVLYLRGIARKDPRDYTLREFSLVSGVFQILFLVLFFGVASRVWIWCRSIAGTEVFLNSGADAARTVYESRTMLGGAAMLVAASVGVFLPILMVMWNATKKSINDAYLRAIEVERGSTIGSDDAAQRGSAPSPTSEALPSIVAGLQADRENLRQMGRLMTPPYYATLIAVVALLVALVFVFVSCELGVAGYMWAVVLLAAGALLLVWFVLLLALFQLWTRTLSISAVSKEPTGPGSSGPMSTEGNDA